MANYLKHFKRCDPPDSNLSGQLYKTFTFLINDNSFWGTVYVADDSYCWLRVGPKGFTGEVQWYAMPFETFLLMTGLASEVENNVKSDIRKRLVV